MEYQNFFFRCCVLTVWFAISCARSTKGAMKTALDTTAFVQTMAVPLSEIEISAYDASFYDHAKVYSIESAQECMDWSLNRSDCLHEFGIAWSATSKTCYCNLDAVKSYPYHHASYVGINIWTFKADSSVCDIVAGGGCDANGRCVSPGACKCNDLFWGDGTLGGTGCTEYEFEMTSTNQSWHYNRYSWSILNPYDCMEWALNNTQCIHELGIAYSSAFTGLCQCPYNRRYSTPKTVAGMDIWTYKADTNVCDTVAGGGCDANARCAYPGRCMCNDLFWGDGTVGGTGCTGYEIEISGVNQKWYYNRASWNILTPYDCMQWALNHSTCVIKELGISYDAQNQWCSCPYNKAKVEPISMEGLNIWTYKAGNSQCDSVDGGGCDANARCAYPGACICNDLFWGDGTRGGTGCTEFVIEKSGPGLTLEDHKSTTGIQSAQECMDWAANNSECLLDYGIAYGKAFGYCRCPWRLLYLDRPASATEDVWTYKASVCDTVAGGGCDSNARCASPGKCICNDLFWGDGTLSGTGCTAFDVEIASTGVHKEMAYCPQTTGILTAQECMDWAENEPTCLLEFGVSFSASQHCRCFDSRLSTPRASTVWNIWTYKADTSVCDDVAGGGCVESAKCLYTEHCECPDLFFGDGTLGGTGCREFTVEITAPSSYINGPKRNYTLDNPQECMEWAQIDPGCLVKTAISWSASKYECWCQAKLDQLTVSNALWDVWSLKASTCNDKKQYGDETGVDCGGSCPKACPTCSDGIRNGDETGTDCGGKHCDECTKLKRPYPVYCKDNEKVQAKKCVPCEAGWTNPAGDDLWGRNSFCRGKTASREGKKLRVRMDGNLTALSDDKQQELKNTLAAKLGVGAEQITLISGSIIVEVAYDTEEEAQAATDSSDVLNEIESTVSATVNDNAVEEEEAANVYGDPHFVGFDGSRYDFRGSSGSIFNIITDEQFQLNARFMESPTDEKTYIGVIGLRSGADQILITPDVVLLNNDPVPKGGHVSLHGKKDEEGLLILTDGRVRVKSSDFQVDVKVAQANGFSYLNIESASAVSDHLVHPHGILGQTAQYMVKGTNPEPVRLSHKNINAQGFLDGSPSDYVVTDGLMGTTFTFNRYGLKKERKVGAVPRRFSFGRAMYLREERS